MRWCHETMVECCLCNHEVKTTIITFIRLSDFILIPMLWAGHRLRGRLLDPPTGSTCSTTITGRATCNHRTTSERHNIGTIVNRGRNGEATRSHAIATTTRHQCPTKADIAERVVRQDQMTSDRNDRNTNTTTDGKARHFLKQAGLNIRAATENKHSAFMVSDSLKWRC